jgi:hypothetical protein
MMPFLQRSLSHWLAAPPPSSGVQQHVNLAEVRHHSLHQALDAVGLRDVGRYSEGALHWQASLGHQVLEFLLRPAGQRQPGLRLSKLTRDGRAQNTGRSGD